MFEVFSGSCQLGKDIFRYRSHARTLAKSAVGDIMKLSLLFDHAIRFCMLESSSMLKGCQRLSVLGLKKSRPV